MTVYLHTYIHIHIYIFIHVCIDTHIYTYTYTHTYIHVHTYVCTLSNTSQLQGDGETLTKYLEWSEEQVQLSGLDVQRQATDE